MGRAVLRPRSTALPPCFTTYDFSVQPAFLTDESVGAAVGVAAELSTLRPRVRTSLDMAAAPAPSTKPSIRQASMHDPLAHSVVRAVTGKPTPAKRSRRSEAGARTTGMRHRRSRPDCPLCPLWGVAWDADDPATYNQQHIHAERLWRAWNGGAW